MDVCNNFQLSLTGGFQECRNCKKEKKFHKLDFDSGTIEYIPKTTNSNACTLTYYSANLLQSKKEQVVAEKLMEEDILKSKACDKFELAITGAFNQCKNCKIEKKYHKLETAGQIPFQPRSSMTKTVQSNPSTQKASAMSEIVQETMMVQSVKDRIAQMNKNAQKPSEPQFRSSYIPEVKEKAPCVAEIVTEQVFTSVQDKKSVFDKPRVRKTIEQANHYIREQNQHHDTQDEQIRRAESQFTQEESNDQNQQQPAEQVDELQQNPFEESQVDHQQQQVESNEQQYHEQQQHEQQEFQQEQNEQQNEQQWNEQQHEQEQHEQEQHEQEQHEQVQHEQEQREQHEQESNQYEESNQQDAETEQINQQEQDEKQEPVQQQQEEIPQQEEEDQY